MSPPPWPSSHRPPVGLALVTDPIFREKKRYLSGKQAHIDKLRTQRLPGPQRDLRFREVLNQGYGSTNFRVFEKKFLKIYILITPNTQYVFGLCTYKHSPKTTCVTAKPLAILLPNGETHCFFPRNLQRPKPRIVRHFKGQSRESTKNRGTIFRFSDSILKRGSGVWFRLANRDKS